MPRSTVEFELKFLVPRKARAVLRAALGERGAKPERRRLVARYFDTADRRLARTGMSLRLRREGRRWVQTLKAGGEAALARFEHEVPRPDGTLDASVHAGTPTGDRVAGLLAGGEPLVQRYGTDIRRVTRRLRMRGTIVELAFDEGRITAQDREWPVCELEFELLTGSRAGLFALAGQWRARFGLMLDVRSKAGRGDALADGRPASAPRRAMPVVLARGACVDEAWRAVLDECIAQVLVNAAGLAASLGVETAATQAGPELPDAGRAELVHQLRIGLRRLRSAFRLFRGWVTPVPESIDDGARELFRALGAARDRDVLAHVIEPALQRAGAPGAPEPGDHTATAPGDPVALVAADAAQHWLLVLLAWRHGLDAAGSLSPGRDEASVEAASEAPAPARLAPLVRRRLARWQRTIGTGARDFAQLDDPARHALRRRTKRLRYAAEFVQPLFPGKEMRRFVERLQAAQQVLGELGDLALGARHHESAPAASARDWFAAGWIAARRDAVAARAADALARLAKCRPFGKR